MPVQVLEAPDAADVGDTLRYWLVVSDYDGVASTATVTGEVTLPDTTTAAMTVTAQATTGLYLITYDTTTDGRHLIDISVTSSTFDDDEVALDVDVRALSGDLPTLTTVKAYLGTTSWSDAEITDALAAETAAQRRRCRIPADYPDDLAQGLKRRVARNLAARAIPVAQYTSFEGGGLTATQVPMLDAEIKRFEAPFRRKTVG